MREALLRMEVWVLTSCSRCRAGLCGETNCHASVYMSSDICLVTAAGPSSRP